MGFIRRARLAMAGLTLVIGGVAVVASATPASAAPAAPAAPAKLLHGDACGPSWGRAVPDSGPVFNFHEPCHWHDWCYGAKPYGRNEVGRARCDAGFYGRMLDSCQNRYPRWYQVVQRTACNQVAQTYYAAVVALGAIQFY
jgi:hypothetical protein